MTSESVSNHFERCETEKYLRRKISMLGELESKELALHNNRVGCFCSTYAGQLWIIDIVVRIRKEGRKRYEKLALGPPALINGVWTVEAPSRGIINSSLVGSVSIHGGKRPGNSSTTRRRSLDPFQTWSLLCVREGRGKREKRAAGRLISCQRIYRWSSALLLNWNSFSFYRVWLLRFRFFFSVVVLNKIKSWRENWYIIVIWMVGNYHVRNCSCSLLFARILCFSCTKRRSYRCNRA